MHAKHKYLYYKHHFSQLKFNLSRATVCLNPHALAQIRDGHCHFEVLRRQIVKYAAKTVESYY